MNHKTLLSAMLGASYKEISYEKVHYPDLVFKLEICTISSVFDNLDQHVDIFAIIDTH